MIGKEEKHIFDSLAIIMDEVHENNLMLRDICEAINTYLSRHHIENEEDFGRNVLANLISNIIDLKKIKRK